MFRFHLVILYLHEVTTQKGKLLYGSAWESRASIGREISVKINDHNGNIATKNSHEGRTVYAIKLTAS